MDIGLKLKELRILKGLTQGGAGRSCGAVKGIYFPDRAESHLAFYRHPDGYPAVPGHDHGRFLHRSPG